MASGLRGTRPHLPHPPCLPHGPKVGDGELGVRPTGTAKFLSSASDSSYPKSVLHECSAPSHVVAFGECAAAANGSATSSVTGATDSSDPDQALAYIVMAYIVMADSSDPDQASAYVVMAYIVMADSTDPDQAPPYAAPDSLQTTDF